MADDFEFFVERDYVYAGLRISKSKNKHVAIIPIEDGVLGKERWYEYKRDRTGTIGGVYRGCSFSQNKVRGLGEAKFVNMWGEQPDRISWSLLDDESKLQEKLIKLEADTAKVSDIDRILAPLRTEYQKMRGRGDYHGANALKNAIVNSLQKTVK